MLQNLVLIVKGPTLPGNWAKAFAGAALGPRRGFHRAQWISLHWLAEPRWAHGVPSPVAAIRSAEFCLRVVDAWTDGYLNKLSSSGQPAGVAALHMLRGAGTDHSETRRLVPRRHEGFSNRWQSRTSYDALSPCVDPKLPRHISTAQKLEPYQDPISQDLRDLGA